MANWIPHQDGDSLAVTGLNTELSQLQTAVNAVDSSAIQIRSLTHEHLPSIIAAQDTVTLTDGTQTFNNSYPGWAVDTIDPALGWMVVWNGSQYLTSSVTATDLTNPAIAGALIMANIEVKNGSDWVWLKIQVQSPIGWTSLPRTERIHTCNNKDIPIRAFVTSADITNPTIMGARVIVATTTGNTNPFVPAAGTATIGACNLSLIVFYGKKN